MLAAGLIFLRCRVSSEGFFEAQATVVVSSMASGYSESVTRTRVKSLGFTTAFRKAIHVTRISTSTNIVCRAVRFKGVGL